LRNHPSRHRKERDDAALLTQEGNSHAFAVSIVLCAVLIMLSPGLCSRKVTLSVRH
jgi:hypothetical protein